MFRENSCKILSVFFTLSVGIVRLPNKDSDISPVATPAIVFTWYDVNICQEPYKLSYGGKVAITLCVCVWESECVCVCVHACVRVLFSDICRKLLSVILRIFEIWIRMNACRCLWQKTGNSHSSPSQLLLLTSSFAASSLPFRRRLPGSKSAECSISLYEEQKTEIEQKTIIPAWGWFCCLIN